MNPPSVAHRILAFYQSLFVLDGLPNDVITMNPYSNTASWDVVSRFYQKYYGDHQKRMALFGINPGRLGGGITGIPFTDPIRLIGSCGINNPFDQKAELSSKFIYEVIDAMDGPNDFYSKFYFTAVSPLGFTKNDKNLNYYDIPNWKSLFENYSSRLIVEQLDFIRDDVAICIGQGENFKFLKYLNDKFHFFGRIITVPHPRWIMQYRLKRKQEFINEYKQQLTLY